MVEVVALSAHRKQLNVALSIYPIVRATAVREFAVSTTAIQVQTAIQPLSTTHSTNTTTIVSADSLPLLLKVLHGGTNSSKLNLERRDSAMKASNREFEWIAALTLLLGMFNVSFADTVDRDAIAAHQDQLQSIHIECEEVRIYDIDPTVAAKEPPNFRHVLIDSKRTEVSALTFDFLNGRAFYDRKTEQMTLAYWASKGLPAIKRQIQTISDTGRIEELTTQILANGKEKSFGGVRQLSDFAPDDTIDIALGLRLLAGRQWLTSQDLSTMTEVQQNDPGMVILRALDGTGHVHEMHFEKSCLYAMSYYRCTGSRGSFVTITNSDFHRYGNVFIPGKILRTSNVVDLKGQMTHPITFTMTVTRVLLNDHSNPPALYNISWPAEMKLFDDRTKDYVEVGPTTRPISDDDIREQLAERRTHNKMLDTLAAEVIQKALKGEPTTRP
jgi:hypothetical protein